MKFIKVFFYYSGLQFIWEKIIPKKKDTPATFTLWILGIYIALFGVSSNRYENTINKVENRISSLVTQLSAGDDIFENAITDVRRIQRVQIPIKPSILNPLTVIQSFYLSNNNNSTLYWLKEIIENFKYKMHNVDLTGIDFENLSLDDGNFNKSDLWDANLKRTWISGANFDNTFLKVARFDNSHGIRTSFKNSNLEKTIFVDSYLPQSYFNSVNSKGASFTNCLLIQSNFTNSKLESVDFSNADLTGSSFRNSTLKNTIFYNTELIGVDFSGSSIDIKSLKRARSLYGSILPNEIEVKMKENYPNLFVKPKYIFPDPFIEKELKKYLKHIFN